MNYPSPYNPCIRCRRNDPPIFQPPNCEGLTAWPIAGFNFPYTNSGDNTTGFVKRFGVATLTSNGTEITSATGDSANTQYILPSGVGANDFVLNLEMFYDAGSSLAFAFFMGSVDANRGLACVFNHPYAPPALDNSTFLGRYCSVIPDIGNVVLFQGELVSWLNGWNSLSVTRTGPNISVNVNGTISNFDLTSGFAFNAGLIWSSNSFIKLRNIYLGT